MGKDNKPIRKYLLCYMHEIVTKFHIDSISDVSSSYRFKAQDSFT